MNDIREQILSGYIKTIGTKTTILPDNHPSRKCGHTTLPTKVTMVEEKSALTAMDEYAIKILQYMHDNEFDFKSFAHTLNYEDAVKILEEIKTKLK